MTLFKTQRKNIFREHRLFRMLRNGVGEIFMVMVGILLALQVNNWNTDRADRVKEVKYLHGLQADLRIDLVNLKVFMEDKDIKASSALRLLRMADPMSAPEIQFADSVLNRLFTWNTFNPSTKTLDELIGSGNLSLLQDDSIKKVMLDVEQRNERLSVHMEHMRREYDLYQYDRSSALREMTPFLVWDNWIEKDTIGYNVKADEARLDELRVQYLTLLRDLTFRNGLQLAILNNHAMRVRCEVLYTEVEHLIALIDKDLMR